MKQYIRPTLVIPTFFIGMLVSGCAQITQLAAPGPVLPPAAAPDYAVAELYVYDNERSETVIAKDGDILTWRTNNGVVRQAYHNFTIPYLSWQTATRRGSSKTDAKPGLLWPLQVGNTEAFNFYRIAEDNDGSNRREYSQSWRCNVDDTKTVQISLGTYDTFKIVCHRYNNGSWRQTRTFYYAPEIGHYIVRHDNFLSGPSARRELTAYGFNSSVFSIAEQQDLTKVVQRALSENPDGQASRWQGTTEHARIDIIPLTTEADAKGAVCRHYKGILYNNQRTRTNKRYACRRADGVWIHSVPKQPSN